MKNVVECEPRCATLSYKKLRDSWLQSKSRQAAACLQLEQLGCHKQGLWKFVCPCWTTFGSTAMHWPLTADWQHQLADDLCVPAPLEPSCMEQVAPMPHTWQRLYESCKLPMEHPVAAILDAPLSLWWAVQQATKAFPGFQATFQERCVIYYLGAQKELDFWPVFLFLSKLLPAQSLHIIFVSPDIPVGLHGQQRAFSSAIPQGLSTANDSQSDTETCSSFRHSLSKPRELSEIAQSQHAVDAAGSSTAALSAADQMKAAADEAGSNADQAAEASAAAASSATCQLHECHQQTHHASEDSSHAGAEGMLQPANASPRMQLSFWKGLYHDVGVQLTEEYGKPKLVFGANAGLAAYPTWVPTLQLLSQAGAPPSIFTDFCEEAAFQAMRVMQATAQQDMNWLPILINPFRSPLSCQGKDNNLPSYSNAFMFGMAPQQAQLHAAQSSPA